MPVSSPSSERERLRAETAHRLVEHAFALLRDEPDTPFSHEAVAARAGMAARTAYRHFPTQDDLVGAVWRHLRDTTGTRWPTREAEIMPFLRALYAQFERNASLTRAFLAARPRADYAVHGSAEGRAAFAQALSARCARLSRSAAAELVATCVAIYSAPFWQMLRDRGQLAPRAAATAACRAMQAVIDASGTPAPTPSTPPTDSDHAKPQRRSRRS